MVGISPVSAHWRMSFDVVNTSKLNAGYQIYYQIVGTNPGSVSTIEAGYITPEVILTTELFSNSSAEQWIQIPRQPKPNRSRSVG